MIIKAEQRSSASAFTPEAQGQAVVLAGMLAGRVRDYFRDPEHRRKFEQWHLETYGEAYEWTPVGEEPARGK